MSSVVVAQLSQPRCGTSWLRAMCGQHPGVQSVAEIRSPHANTYMAWHRETGGLFPEYIEWLRATFDGAVIVDAKVDQLEATPMALDSLASFDKLLALHRRNDLRTVVSYEQMRQRVARGEQSNRLVGEPTGPEVVTLNVGDTILAMKRLRARRAWIDAACRGRDSLTVWYEDVVNFPARETGRVWEWLGLSPVEIAPTYKRLNPYPLREVVTNLDELRLPKAWRWMIGDETWSDIVRGGAN